MRVRVRGDADSEKKNIFQPVQKCLRAKKTLRKSFH